MDAPKSHARPKRRGRQSLEEQVEQLAGIVRGSKHLVVYTGAGISTSAGIPDYRGPAGVWTLKAQGKRPPPVAYTQARPSYAHRALSLLVQAGLVKHVVTQNVDGLHRASGVPGEKLSELHGNARMERCDDCGRDYVREYATWSVTAGAGSSPASARAKRRRSSERASPSGARAHAPGRLSPSDRPTLPSGSFPPSDSSPLSDGPSTSRNPNGSAPPDKPQLSDNPRPSDNRPLSGRFFPSKHLAQPQPSDHRAQSDLLRPSDHSPPSDHFPRSDRSLPSDRFHSPPSDHRSPTESHRRCESPSCAGLLRHCVTLFGEPLPDFAVCSAERETALADAALVLGSSLRVAPACDYPADVAADGGRLAIVNLQPTPLDAKADVVIRRGCDQVMELLVSKLGLDIGLIRISARARAADKPSSLGMYVKKDDKLRQQ